MTEKLTPQQRKILTAVAKHDAGLVAFNGDGSRKHGFGIVPAEYGGVIVRAYGVPEYSLKHRGFIAPVERNVGGIWFKITDAGKAAINS